jgi:hypothetical protein
MYGRPSFCIRFCGVRIFQFFARSANDDDDDDDDDARVRENHKKLFVSSFYIKSPCLHDDSLCHVPHEQSIIRDFMLFVFKA